MFTGIIEDLGIVRGLSKTKTGARLGIVSKKCASDTKIGDSISINGACLTVTDIAKEIISFDISAETLARTNLGALKSDDKVNIERALKGDSRLGGHFVLGHIDGRGRIISKKKQGEFIDIEIELPQHIMAYLAEKGSIAIDGISLTINNIKEQSLSVFLIPHTLSITTLGFKRRGDFVNIETDILAKYMSRQLNQPSQKSSSNVTKDFLHQHGFI